MKKIKLNIRFWWNNRKIDKVNEKNLKPIDSSNNIKKWIWLSFKIFILIFFASLLIFPFFYMISTSLLSDEEVESTLKSSHLIPRHGLHWENFEKAFKEGFWKALFFTAIVTAISVSLKLVVTMAMGYAFSYKKWRFKNTIWYSFLIIMMIPEVGLLVGQLIVVQNLKMDVGPQIIFSITLPFIASVFSGFMFKNAFEEISIHIKEAAMIDGANEWTYFWKIAVPIVKPTIWTVIILTAFASWNSFMWPQIILNGNNNDIQVLGTWLFTTGKKLDSSGVEDGTILINVRMASAIIVMLPMIISYFIFRKKFMNSISIKGNTVKG
ncbi:MAG: carbohydrate ABC transporter permease [Mollicutes bacterium PWAP]|nr:carbohydrate ABC transporter permease [Mollicutes bacterium PWAP]